MNAGSHGSRLLSIGLFGIPPLVVCQQTRHRRGEDSTTTSTGEVHYPLSDATPLESYLKAGIRARTNSYSAIQTGDGPTTVLVTLAGDNTSRSFSSTNLQKVWVNEADLIKNDGEWLDLLSRQRLKQT